MVSKEKENLSLSLENTKKDFDAYKVSCKAKFRSIDENEISLMKDKINTLSNTLKKYEFDKAKLEFLFLKRHTQRKPPPHISHTHHVHTYTQHAHHAHNTHHSFMYANVYSCTYCDRKGHLAKFCYDRLNIANNHVCVHKTNFIGPKKIWVSESTPILNDIGTHKAPKT